MTERLTLADLTARLQGGLIVSCQPVPGGPFDTVDAVAAYARVAEAGGAVGLRVEGVRNVEGAVGASRLPVVGLIKRDLDDSAVRITPYDEDVEALVRAGATVVAVDATDRPRPVPSAQLIATIKRLGAIAMADIATQAEARAALAAGADITGTTMSGYTGPEPAPTMPDIELIRACSTLGAPVLAGGRYNSPHLAAAAIRAGALAVVVGSAITRPEHIVSWFKEAVEVAARPSEPVLAFDIGGTKTLAALVRGSKVLDRKLMATRRDIGAPGWIAELVAMADGWRGKYASAAAAVTGLVVDGKWSSLNPGTLVIPDNYPITRKLSDALGVPVEVVNDAQAAAWGEHRFGAARGRDMAFLTVSSGIGGGLVLGGRLLRGARGLAGSLGQSPRITATGPVRLEALASGFGVAAASRAAGHNGDARTVFAAAQTGEAWAEDILGASVTELAAAVAGLQAVIDPDCIVIGGGVGLAEGYLQRLRHALDSFPNVLIPNLVRPALGVDAGIIGAADLVAHPHGDGCGRHA